MRFNFEIDVTLSISEIEKTILSCSEIKKYINRDDIKKIIIVPKRIINIVT